MVKKVTKSGANAPELDPAFVAELKNSKQKLELTRTTKLSLEKAEEVLEKFRSNAELASKDQALAVIAALCHQGGTARKCDGNLTVTLFGKAIKLATLRKTLRECSVAKSERKLARTYATKIQQIALILEIPGNLATKIQRAKPDEEWDLEALTWLSDFQTENPDCPPEAKTLIIESFSYKSRNSEKSKD